MACTQCEELAQTVNIRVPTDLKNVIAVAKAAIQDGIIEEIELSKWGGPFSLINADGPWDDIVGHRFGCRHCQQKFELTAETYHGSGGAWKSL